MKQVSLFASAFIVTLIVSCGTKSEEAQVDTPADINQLPQAVTTTPVTNSSQPIVAPTISAPVNPQPQTAVANTTGLNPAHGQPGHRCDIAVGAPLNSAPAVTNTTSKTNQQQPVVINNNPIVTPPAPAKSVAAGMNPAHGEPGHRCDIAVGAPLNSPPGNQTAANKNPVNLQPSINNTAPKITTPAATTSVAPGMNPAHGQPGHRCDIAVGAPLSSAPATKTAVPAISEPAKINN